MLCFSSSIFSSLWSRLSLPIVGRHSKWKFYFEQFTVILQDSDLIIRESLFIEKKSAINTECPSVAVGIRCDACVIMPSHTYKQTGLSMETNGDMFALSGIASHWRRYNPGFQLRNEKWFMNCQSYLCIVSSTVSLELWQRDKNFWVFKSFKSLQDTYSARKEHSK